MVSHVIFLVEIVRGQCFFAKKKKYHADDTRFKYFFTRIVVNPYLIRGGRFLTSALMQLPTVQN